MDFIRTEIIKTLGNNTYKSIAGGFPKRKSLTLYNGSGLGGKVLRTFSATDHSRDVVHHLRKTIYIALIIGFLISCGNDKTLSEIEKYVTEIDNRKDLSESITEFNTEDLNGEIAGGISIYELTDNNGEIYRIIAEIGQPNQSPSNYEFYFKKDSLTFAKIVEFNETGTDTIINSEYYYDGVKLLKQTNWKEEKMDAETVRQVSEFYLVYGKQTTE